MALYDNTGFSALAGQEINQLQFNLKHVHTILYFIFFYLINHQYRWCLFRNIFSKIIRNISEHTFISLIHIVTGRCNIKQILGSLTTKILSTNWQQSRSITTRDVALTLTQSICVENHKIFNTYYMLPFICQLFFMNTTSVYSF